MIREGEGLAVVAIHGNGVDHRILKAFDDALEQAGGLERIYLDLPGFGQTPALKEREGCRDWRSGSSRRLSTSSATARSRSSPTRWAGC